MNRKLSRKTIYIFLAIFIFTIFAMLEGVRTHFFWADMQYFGKITEIRNDGFTLKNDEDSLRFILIDQNTDIRRGRKPWTEELREGDFVVVVGPVNQENSIEAKVIRIVTPPRSSP